MDKKLFDEWLETCPVDYEFTNEIDNGDSTTEFYFFRIPKERIKNYG
jgi:hypothetical protein|tara:strand:+ start:253 stop:393 length:141 start_codon:yes stop_codon:yes gene_type:complete